LGEPNQAHLDTATGARPSSGAASFNFASVFEQFSAGLLADIAAPEDRRSPVPLPLVVAGRLPLKNGKLTLASRPQTPMFYGA